MSYILDALRKADAERERDPARGIHAQPAAPQPTPAGRGPLAMWAAGAALAIGVAAAAWLAVGHEKPAAPLAAGAPPTGATAAAPATAQAQAIPPAAVSVPVADAVQPAPPPMPMPMPAAARPGGSVAAAPMPPPTSSAPAVAPITPRASVPPASVATPPSAASQPASTAASERVHTLAELPPDVQRELPKIAITGGVHSDNAAQRMLIVGGQVMAEGSELAPGLVLEQIRPKTAVLRWRQWRYSVVY